MANVKFTKPQTIGRLFYSYWDGSAWSSHVEVTDTFLNDTTKGHVGTVSGLASLSDNLTEKDRFIMYYGSYVNGVWTPASGTLDCIALVNMTQISGLTLLTYADDSIDIGSVPTTLIDTHVQSAGSGLYSTKSELIEFTEETAECFMVERQGIASYNAGSSAPNLLVNATEITSSDNWTFSDGSAVSYVASAFPYDDNGIQFVDSGGWGLSRAEHAEQVINVSPASDVTLTYDITLDYQNLGDLCTLNIYAFSDATTTTLLASYTGVNPANLQYTHTQSSSDTHFGVRIEFTSSPIDNPGTALVGRFSSVEISSSTAYTGSPIDTRAIVFGGDALQPTRNFENGQEQDDSNKWSTNITNSSSYQTKTNSIRKDMLQFELFSDAQKQLLQDLDKELNEGLCIYQRDGDSTDDNEWFVGRFMIQPNTAQFTDLNSIQASVTELAAREI